ncbi:hypothetical protein [Moorena producens]|uniref:hypothetical protein n=1 Tax=Moorena producens TaxID=1155739 RepID=UPI003C788031
MPILRLITQARCQFYRWDHWQDASSTVGDSGKMPVLPLGQWQDASSTVVTLARCRFYR